MAKQRTKVSVPVVEVQLTEIPQPAREEVAQLAYGRWQARGCPHGSPEEDWFAAEEVQPTLEEGDGGKLQSNPRHNRQKQLKLRRFVYAYRFGLDRRRLCSRRWWTDFLAD